MAYSVPEISLSCATPEPAISIIVGTILGSVASGVSGGIASAVFG